MSHEPECPHNDSVCDCQITECSACHCQSIRAAYQRGREDAAEAVRQLHRPVEISDGWNSLTVCSCNGAEITVSQGVTTVRYYEYPCPTLIAARGGEQE